MTMLCDSASKRKSRTSASGAQCQESQLPPLIDQHLSSLQPGWSLDQVNVFIKSLARAVVTLEIASETTSLDIAHRLADQLTRHHYSSDLTAQFPSLVEKIQQGEHKKREIAKAAYFLAQAGGDKPDASGHYVIDDQSREPDGQPVLPKRWGIYRLGKTTSDRLTNFTLILDEDVEILDDPDGQRVFVGRLSLAGHDVPFRISARDFAANDALRAAIFAAAGPQAQILCPVDALRIAISCLSQAVIRRQVTTSLGWTNDGSAYLVPGGHITAAGFMPASSPEDLVVDLEGEELAEHLGLQPLEVAELSRVKRHIVDDFLGLHERRVTYALLAAVGAALLFPFSNGLGRFALWLTGLTGSGKSFAAKLAMNFFGDFPVSASGRFASWTSTANFLQRTGWFFKDALFLIDDYKPEATPHYQAVRLLQNYADSAGRGRLKSDATANVTRAIRGLLVSTGEDVPEHAASAIARSVVIQVPQGAKNVDRGYRCLAECPFYSGVTTDLIRRLLAKGRTDSYGRFVQALQRRYVQGAKGQQNDLRIAANLAQLGAGFVELASFLADVWPAWKAAVRWFVFEALPALRDEMLGEARDQQASEIFLATLRDLIEHEQVRLDLNPRDDHKPVIGRRLRSGVSQIATSLAMASVQEHLRRQGRPLLRITERTLLDQLRQDGKLSDSEGKPLTAQTSPTKQVRVDGNPKQCFAIHLSVLKGEAATAAEAEAMEARRGLADPLFIRNRVMSFAPPSPAMASS